ncbi:MAG: hypothetical protein INR69_22050, partial [Mucilaginibacter polytrichastri]|nr:hypothetical protein [Mucilaginibacter polytrichastri]
MNDFIDEFRPLFLAATSKIPKIYFQLPVAEPDGEVILIYRERVYTYELYHQLRCLWTDGTPFYLCGEVDKTNSPIYKETSVNGLKPDLLVHVPGQAENLAVIEVKPINAANREILKDLCSLEAFMHHAGYKKAFLLIYGANENGHLDRIIRLL